MHKINSIIDIKEDWRLSFISLLIRQQDNGSKTGGNVNEVLAQELHKPVIKKLKKRKFYSMPKDNILAVDLTQLRSLTSSNHSVKHLFYMIDVFVKYAWVKLLNDKKAKTFFDGFIGKVNESKRTPNKLWTDQGRDLYNNLMQMWLDDNNILMYLTCNDGEISGC